MEPGHSAHRGRKIGLALAWIISGAGIGIVFITFPFVVPALRRFCLPYVPATDTQIKHVLTQLSGRTGKVVDLGSGDGRVVIAAAKEGHRAVGYELNPWLVLYSRWRAYRGGVYGQATFHCKDLWKVPLHGYRNIIFFGVEQMMDPLASKILKEAPADSRVIACRYPFSGWTPAVKFDLGANSVFVYDQLPRENVDSSTSPPGSRLQEMGVSLPLGVELCSLSIVGAHGAVWPIPREIAFPFVAGIASFYFVVTLVLLAITVRYGLMTVAARRDQSGAMHRRSRRIRRGLFGMASHPRCMSRTNVNSDIVLSNINAESDEASSLRERSTQETTFVAEKSQRPQAPAVGAEDRRKRYSNPFSQEHPAPVGVAPHPDHTPEARQMADKWYRIGQELGLEPSCLKKIEIQNKADTTRRIKDVAKTWLQSAPSGSWIDVVEALERCQEPELARKIAALHCDDDARVSRE